MNCVSPQSVKETEQISLLISGLKKEIVEVVFGTPSKNCTGMGICMVARPNSAFLKRIICPSVLSRASCLNKQSVSFEFHRDDIDPVVIMQRFLQPIFLIEEPFMLPDYLVRKWSLETRWIAQGAYPLTFQDNTWRITCKLDHSVRSSGLALKNKINY